MDRLYKIVGLFNNLSILFSYDYISLIIESFIILSFYLTTFAVKNNTLLIKYIILTSLYVVTNLLL